MELKHVLKRYHIVTVASFALRIEEALDLDLKVTPSYGAQLKLFVLANSGHLSQCVFSIALMKLELHLRKDLVDSHPRVRRHPDKCSPFVI